MSDGAGFPGCRVPGFMAWAMECVYGAAHVVPCILLSHGSTQPRTAVNYVTGFLINDNFQLLERIASDSLPGTSLAVLQRLSILSEWLKHGSEQVYENGSVPDNNSCPRHLIQFGLSKPVSESARAAKRKDANGPKKKASRLSQVKATMLPNTNAAGDPTEAINGTNISVLRSAIELLSETRMVSCQQCMAMDTIFDDFRHQLEETNPAPSTLNVLDDAYENMELYLSHRVSVSNQQRALQKVVDDMKTKCTVHKSTSEAIIIIDFKMKLEPIYYREKTVEHYGKRGMSWHGALLRYWTYDSTSGSAQENKVYMDQISSCDNKQDKESVVALVEGILGSIRRAFPFIARVTFQSDNASCYQNTFVALMLPLIGALHNIEVVRFIHSESQEGKCVLDAHFATATRKVRSWVCQGHDAATPKVVVTALSSDGGLPNCLVELVEYDRVKMSAIFQQVEPLTKSLERDITRFNDVIYNHPPITSCLQWQDSFYAKLWPPFTITIYEYAGVGDGIEVSVVPSLDRCKCSENPGNDIPMESRDTLTEASTNDVRDDSDSGADPNQMDFDEFENESDESDDEWDELTSTPDDTVVAISIVVGLPGESFGVLSGIRIVRYGLLRMRASNMMIESHSLRNQSQNRSYTDKDIKAYAKRCLIDMHSGGDFGDIVLPADLGTKLVSMSNICGKQRRRESTLLKPGWARRQKKGHMYGAKYIDVYKDEVEELFNRGVADSSAKMGPARMREVLAKQCPYRFDLPDENELQTWISTLLQKQKKGVTTVSTVKSKNPKQSNAKSRRHNNAILTGRLRVWKG